MGVGTRLITAEEFSRLRDEPNVHELIRGEVITMPPPQSEHGYLAATILILLGGHVRANRLGFVFAAETGFLLESDPDTVRAADVSFVVAARYPAGRPTEGYVQGAPDFLAEVLSPNDTAYGAEEKVQAWLRAGARLVWLVNPKQRSVTVYRPGQPPALVNEAETLDATDVVAGFRLRVAEIFA